MSYIDTLKYMNKCYIILYKYVYKWRLLMWLIYIIYIYIPIDAMWPHVATRYSLRNSKSDGLWKPACRRLAKSMLQRMAGKRRSLKLAVQKYLKVQPRAMKARDTHPGNVWVIQNVKIDTYRFIACTTPLKTDLKPKIAPGM